MINAFHRKASRSKLLNTQGGKLQQTDSLLGIVTGEGLIVSILNYSLSFPGGREAKQQQLQIHVEPDNPAWILTFAGCMHGTVNF